jgi:hypothetical protein
MSARLGIDFKRRRGITPLGVGLLLAGLGATAGIGNLHQQTADRVANWENAVNRVSRQTKLPLQSVSANPHQALDLPHVQDVLKRLNMPWDRLFTALEKATGNDVALVSLKPDPSRGLVRIGGEARNLYAMLAYAKRLQDAKYFSEVTLADHEIAPKGGDKPVHFQLLAKWKP